MQLQHLGVCSQGDYFNFANLISYVKFTRKSYLLHYMFQSTIKINRIKQNISKYPNGFTVDAY